MRLCVAGTGYVGLVSAACFAELGHHVVCADSAADRIARIRRGDLPVFEDGLSELVQRNVASGRLAFTSDAADAITGSNVVVVAVGTPPLPDGSADVSAVESVARLVHATVAAPTVLLIKSTVPVGTHGRIASLVRGAPVAVASNPEFLREGTAVEDFMHPDRIVLGVRNDDAHAREVLALLYRPFADRLLWMSPASAELTKYASNAMLATRLSFMNELSRLCEAVGGDIDSVRLGVGSDRRIGPDFLHAGPGYGGPCLTKDVTALIQTARSHGIELALATATDAVNTKQRGVLHEKLRTMLRDSIHRARVGIWGLAFKPDTDDTRASPAFDLIEALLADGATVIAHDPRGMPSVRERFENRVRLVEDPYSAAAGSDALVLVTEWAEYRSPDFTRLKALLRRAVLLDGRNAWTSHRPWDLGFTYDGIGTRAARE